MSLEKRLSENMLRFGVKNLNETSIDNLTIKYQSNIINDYFSDSTYYDKFGVLVENAFFLQEQTKMRQAMSAVRRAVQSTPLMVKWQNWRTKRFIKKNGLPSKADLMSRDSEQVKATPGYEEVMFLLYNKRTMDPASIMFWNGAPALGGDENPEDKREFGQLITQLSRFNGLEFGSYNNETVKIDISGFLEALKKLYDSNVYLTADDLLEIFTPDSGLALNALFSLAITTKYDGQQYDIDVPQSYEAFEKKFYQTEGTSFPFQLEKDLKRLENFSTKLAIAGGGSEGSGRYKKGAVDSIATYAVEMSDEEKIKICRGVNTKIISDKQDIGPKLRLEDYTDFYISPDELSIKSNIIVSKEKVGGETVEVVGTYYSYPDNPNDPAQANVIFGNEDDITEWKNTGPFVDSVRQKIDAIQKDGWTILRVECNAGARSSKVGTTKYNGKTEAQKTLGNERLCKERAKGITTALEPIFKQLLPDAALMVGEPNLHANEGPGWYEYDTAGESYGPLYESYRRDNPDTEPIDFYMARTIKGQAGPNFGTVQAKGFKGTHQQIKDEYEQVYGPHRGTYAGYALYCYQETPSIDKPKSQPDFEIETTGTFFFTLQYNVVTIRDVGQSTKRWIKSRWRKVRRALRKIDLSKIKFQSLGEGMNLIDICDAYN